MKTINIKTVLVCIVMLFGMSSWAHSHDSHNHSKGDHAKHKEHKTEDKKEATAETKAEVQGGEKITVSVNGMVCSFCSTNIENKLKKNKEVQSVKVDLDKKKVEIILKEGQTFADKKIKSEIKKSGYSVVNIKRG